MRRRRASRSYKYVKNYSKSTLSECKKFDKHNQKMYKRSMGLYTDVNKKIRRQSVRMEKIPEPDPPRETTNEEMFNIYHSRTKRKNNKKQTLAVLYLSLIHI